MAAETFGGATVIIDLGLARGEPDEYARPARSTVPNLFPAMIIAVVVLLSSAASAAPPPPALTPVLTVTVGPADPFALTADGDLLTQTEGTLSAYGLADGRLRWQAGASSPSYRLRTSAGLVLLRPWNGTSGDPGTTAISLADGVARWRRTGNVVTVAGSPTLLAVSGVRSMSGSGRRVRGPVDAVDPASGVARWQVTVPSTAVLLGVPGPAGAPARMLLVHDNRTAVVHDLGTGARLTSAELPPADYGPDNPTVAGGLLLLHHPTATGRMVTAYDPVTLARRWSRPAGFAFAVTPCGRLACLTGPDGVRAVDPASGVQRWYESRWRGVEQRGDMLVAYGTPVGETDPVGVVDPATGQVLTDLSGWRLVPGSGGDHLLVTRMADAGTRTMVAVVDRGAARPALLADLPEGTGDCQFALARIACRSASGDLAVWAYQRKV
jgi:outer membrane protein assembly factor BamB